MKCMYSYSKTWWDVTCFGLFQDVHVWTDWKRKIMGKLSSPGWFTWKIAVEMGCACVFTLHLTGDTLYSVSQKK